MGRRQAVKLAAAEVVAAVGQALLFSGEGSSGVGGFRAMFYAVLIVFGGLLPCLAGMMCKIVPFLTWMRAYGPRVGRGPTPAASTLARVSWCGFFMVSAPLRKLTG